MNKGNKAIVGGLVTLGVMVGIAVWGHFCEFRPAQQFDEVAWQIGHLEDKVDELFDHWDELCPEQGDVAEEVSQMTSNATEFNAHHFFNDARDEVDDAYSLLRNTFPVDKTPWLYRPHELPQEF